MNKDHTCAHTQGHVYLINCFWGERSSCPIKEKICHVNKQIMWIRACWAQAGLMGGSVQVQRLTFVWKGSRRPKWNNNIVEYFTWRLPHIEKFRQCDVRMSASAQICYVFRQQGGSWGKGSVSDSGWANKTNPPSQQWDMSRPFCSWIGTNVKQR